MRNVAHNRLGFIDNLYASSDTVNDLTACSSAIHMQSPFIDEISRSITENGGPERERDKPLAMTEHRRR